MSRPCRPPRDAGRRAATALAAALVTLAAGCGGGGSAPAPAPAPAPSPAATAATDVDWVRAVMTDLYLYADRVPKADLDGLATAAQALEALRVNPPDRFSYVEDRAAFDAFFDDGRAVGLGIALRLDGDALVLRAVMPDSPAGRAGLQRGDRIVAIDDVDVATLVARGTLSDALGPSRDGWTLRLGRVRDGARTDITLVKGPYTVAPVLAVRTLAAGGTTVGYVALNTFAETARAAWTDALDTLRAQGARHLVVDLRENGGGRLHVAASVAGSLVPPGLEGRTFVSLRHNAARAADDLDVPLPADPAAGAFDRVAWLVSDLSCSASEALIAGLRPWRSSAVVGTTTCGKPVGFDPQTRGTLVLSAVSFAVRDRDGRGDWFDGLRPDCPVGEEPYLPFGDPADPRLARALQWVTTGECGGTGETTKAAAPRRGAVPAARGMATLTGLW